MPTRSNMPNCLLSAAISRSPWYTLMPTCVWLSAAVLKTCDFLVGMVVLRLIMRVNTPPRVSMPRDRGVTSNSRMSFTSPRSTPPWMAAPMATTSSGFTPREASLPKISLTISATLGMRVMPPTNNTSVTSLGKTPASLRHFLHGSLVRSKSSPTSCSSLARVRVITMCLGPLWSAVMKGRLISVVVVELSSHLAFSAASRNRCSAILSFARSMPCSFLNSAHKCCKMVLSKSSPPRKVSPLVAFTSNTPPMISRMETSKVPPPKS
mmetsp:Transcript_12349/g.21868  ORF Transcript_12349/g.21868 Transcript_12349/m.21868 type:complete len:266 (+) Transcript_12349:1039-1836(+)